MPEQSPTTRLDPSPADNGSWFARHKVLTGVSAGFLWAFILVLAVSAADADTPKPAVTVAAPVHLKPTAVVPTPVETGETAKNDTAYRAALAKAAAAADRRTMIGDNTSCQSIDAEAVRISKKTTFDVKLAAVRSPEIVADHRSTFTKPSGRDSSLVLSCQGTALLSTGDTQAILVSLSVDSDGVTFVDYQAR